MSLVRLRLAMRRRMERAAADGDSGFALLYVLLVTMIVTAGVATALVSATNAILPAKNNQDDVRALAAARAGLDDYLAFLNANCSTFNSSKCSSITGTPYTATVLGTDSKGTEGFQRTVLNPTNYLADGFVRVKSVGWSDATKTHTKTLVADLAGLPNVLRFAYMSKYETLAQAFVNSYYPARSIVIDNAAAATASDNVTPAITASPASPATVTWTAPSGSDICDKLWYDDPSNPIDAAEANPAGAGVDPAYQEPGRGTVKTSYRSGIPVGADWTQSTSAGGSATVYQPCEVTFTSGMTFTGPVYSKDAVLLSYGTTGGSGPTFTIPSAEILPPVSTGWRTSSFPGAVPGQLYRQFPFILGAPSTSSTFASTNNTVQTSAYDLQLPTNNSDAAGMATCIFTGPTRVVVNGGTATIISPLTVANPATKPAGTSDACYTNQALTSGATSTITSTGVYNAQVPISSTVIYVQNKGTGATGAKASGTKPLFNLATPASTTTPVTGTPTVTATDAGYVPTLVSNPSTQSDGTWFPKWTGYTNVLSCALSSLNLTTPADYAWFNCSVPRTANPSPAFTDSYSYVKYWVKQALAQNPTNYTTGSAFANLVNSYVSLGNTSEPLSQTWPNNTGFSGRRYTVTDTSSTSTPGCTPTTTNSSGTPVNVARPSNDKFLSQTQQGTTTPQTTATITCVSATVTLQEGMRTSNLNGNLNSCNQSNCGWGDGVTVGASVPQFKVTAKISTPANSSQTTATIVSFPDPKDVTQYSTWDTASAASAANAPGDLYVEGTGITGKLSLVAQNDVVVTGPLTTTKTTTTNVFGEPSWASGGAVALVAKSNVRLYHPMSCADTTTTVTTAGYCPNDISGLYKTGGETNGTLASWHPAMQYCNMLTGAAVNSNCLNPTYTGTGVANEVDAVVFALNGSLMADNFNRGMPLGTAKVVGGIFQLHRGATGQQWETAATDTSRAYSGYSLQDSYLAMDTSGIPYVPALQSGSSKHAWNIVSVSSG